MARIFKPNLQTKITFSIFIVGFISTVLGLALVYYFGKFTLEKTIGRGYAEIADVTSQKLATLIDHHIEEAHFLSSSQDIVNEVTKSNHSKAISESLRLKWPNLNENDSEIKMILQNEGSQFIHSYEAFEDREHAGTPMHHYIFATDLQGTVVSSNIKTPQLDYHQEKWWKNAYGNGKGSIYIGDILYDPSIKSYTFDIAIPIYKNGAVIGIFKMVHDADAFFKWVTSIKTGKHDHTMLVSSDGTILYCPIFPTKTHRVSLELQQKIFKPEPGWNVSTVDVHYPGREALNGFAPLDITFQSAPENFGGKKWYVFTSQDPAETFAPIYTLSKLILSAGLMGIGVLTFLGWLVSKKLVQPIRNLQKGIQYIGNGQLDHRINIKTGDEIEEVGNEFNEMAKKMQAFYLGLEQKVSERTKELENRTKELEHRNNDMYTLFSMGATLNECESREEILSVIPGKVMGMMKADGVIISLLNPSKELFLKGLPTSILKQAEAKTLFQNILKVFLSREDFFITLNAGDENGIREIKIPSPFEFNTIASVPLFAKNEIIGGLALLFKRTHHLTAQEEELLTAIGHQLGNAIENMQRMPPLKKT